MKDIDFEELDKAVNSLMQTAAETGATPEISSAKTATTLVNGVPSTQTQVASTPASIPAPVPTTVEPDSASPVEPESPAVTEPTSVPLAAKRSGRFMDVVHPSSDMRVSDKPTMPSRTGVSIEPINQIVAEPDVEAKTGEENTVTPEDVATTEPNTNFPQDHSDTTDSAVNTPDSQTTDSTVMPDPIDMHEKVASANEMYDQPVAAAEPVVEIDEDDLAKQLEESARFAANDIPSKDPPTEAAVDENVSDAQESALELKAEETPEESEQLPELDELLTSPFLPDAKVEKRPLGSLAVLTEPIPDEPMQKDNDLDGMKDTPEAVPVVVPELQAANDVENKIAVPDVSDEQEKSSTLPAELRSDVTAIEASATKEEVTHAGSKLDTTSISQQYKAAETSVEDKHHEALYDSASTGVTLAHPAKKKSGWMWVVWVVLLIVLGAGGAAAVWYLKLM